MRGYSRRITRFVKPCLRSGLPAASALQYATVGKDELRMPRASRKDLGSFSRLPRHREHALQARRDFEIIATACP
jgi:hypothetical protein